MKLDGITSPTDDDLLPYAQMIEKVLDAEPDLTWTGFFVPERGEGKRAAAERKEIDRIKMLTRDGVISFVAAYQYVQQLGQQTGKVRQISSYFLKQYAQEHSKKGRRDGGEYVSNGAFIAAGIALGLPMAEDRDAATPFASFYVSPKALERDV